MSGPDPTASQGLHLELGDRSIDDGGVDRVEHRVLAGLHREANAAFACEPAELRKFLRALLDLAVELREIRM